MVIIPPHICASRFDYCLVNKIFILVFYASSVISLVRHWYIMIYVLIIPANLPQYVISHLSIIFDYCRGQKWIHVRTWVFLIKACWKLRIGLLNLPCILVPEIVHCFDFALKDLKPWLHTLSAVALKSAHIELSELCLTVRAHDKSIGHGFDFHPLHRLQEKASTLWKLTFVAGDWHLWGLKVVDAQRWWTHAYHVIVSMIYNILISK